MLNLYEIIPSVSEHVQAHYFLHKIYEKSSGLKCPTTQQFQTVTLISVCLPDSVFNKSAVILDTNTMKKATFMILF